MRVAIVHDWLTSMRGPEVVLGAITELFPKATLFTSFVVPGKISPGITALKRQTSVLQKVPGIGKRYLGLRRLMPWALQRLDLSSFDVILSSSHTAAHAVKKREDALHVAYLHEVSPLSSRWQQDAFQRIDVVVTNSAYTQSKLFEQLQVKSEVISPFCEADRFKGVRQQGRTYLLMSDFNPENLDGVRLAIEAFNELKLPLLIVGTSGGSRAEARLKRLAHSGIDFVGSLSDSAIADLFAKCRALVIPNERSFSVSALEALAAGTPVIAYARSGVREVLTQDTGLLFEEKTVAGLVASLRDFEKNPARFVEGHCRAAAAPFTKERFQKEFMSVLFKEYFKRHRDDLMRGPLLAELERSWVDWDVLGLAEGYR